MWTARMEQSDPRRLQWPWCASPLHSLSSLSARRSHLLPVMSLKCDSFITVDDQVNKHVPIQFHHWDCQFEFRWDHKCTFAFPFLFLARMHEKLWNMGLNVFLCVSDGVCPYACPLATDRLQLKRIFRINIKMLERFSKYVGKFQIWLKSGKKRTHNITTYTHFWLQLYPN